MTSHESTREGVKRQVDELPTAPVGSSSSEPLVSIITPCYNGEAHVGRLIDSVLAQTYPNIEFILVNDGSTDLTEEVVGGYRQRLESKLARFVYVGQANAGLGGAINGGLRHVTGDYLCWPDADDYLEPESVTARVRVLEAHPECAIVTSDAYIRNENDAHTIVGKVSERFESNQEPQQFARLLQADSIFTPGCHMARMSAFDETHPGRQIFPARRGQNWQMLLPLYYRYPRYFLNLPLYNYVVHESSMSRGDQTPQNQIERLREHRQIRQKTLESMAMEPAERARWERVVQATFLRGLAAVHLGAGDVAEATKAFRQLSTEYGVATRERLRFHGKLLARRLGHAPERVRTKASERSVTAGQTTLDTWQQPAAALASTSVLVTTYNGERFVGAQLESILNQTKPVDQVLICDDGSTDGTVERVRGFLAAYEPPGWSIQVNEPNLGVSANVLTHIAQLDGDFVFLADQDDIWEPNKVEVMSAYLAENPRVSLVVSRARLIDDQGKEILDRSVRRQASGGGASTRRQSRYVEPLGFRDFIGYSTIPLHAMCVRGSVLRAISKAGGFPALSRSLGADWYIGIWSTVVGEAGRLRDRLVRRRVHDSNISLGRLRKDTALAGTPEARLLMLREVRDAHQALLENESLSSHLSTKQRRQVEQMVGFLGARIEFATQPAPAKALGLLTEADYYRQSSGSVLGGLRMFVADVMYAYRINWRLPRRSS